MLLPFELLLVMMLMTADVGRRNNIVIVANEKNNVR
jgi:hypothetical protein